MFITFIAQIIIYMLMFKYIIGSTSGVFGFLGIFLFIILSVYMVLFLPIAENSEIMFLFTAKFVCYKRLVRIRHTSGHLLNFLTIHRTYAKI